MKILQVLRAPTGGLWRHVVDLSEHLALRGHELGIVFDAGFADPQTNSGVMRLEPLLKFGVRRVPIARQPAPSDIPAALAIRRIARDLNVDIIHGHGAKGGLFARLARMGGARQASVYTPHGGVLNFDRRSLAGRGFRLAEKMLMPLTDAVIFESAFARDAYFEQIGTPGHAAEVIHNGLQPGDLERLDTRGVEFDFVFVGELRAVKGVSYLLNALSQVKRSDGKPPRLLLVGGGPEEQAYREQIARLGLDGQVEMAGVQPARPSFARGACAVIPSLAESLPYVVLEAAGAGRQVITTRVGGIGEIFGPTADKLVPPADVPALKAAMQAFLDNPGAAKSEIDARYAYVKTTFSITRMVDAIEALYARIQRR